MRTSQPTTDEIIVKADETPRIVDLVPGATIYRWAVTRTLHLVSELPCHRDQMASVVYDPTTRAIIRDQAVVCRRCFTRYAATPVGSTPDFAWYRIVYRHAGQVAMSRPKRRGE